MKVLIIKPSSLGDIIQALPVAGSWKAHDPAVHIDWLVFDSFAELLQGHPFLDRVWVLPKSCLKNPFLLWEWSRELRGVEYDVVLDLQGLARSAILTRLARARQRVGLASAREGARLFYDRLISDTAPAAASRYLQALELWNIPARPNAFGLSAPTALPVGLEAGRYRVLHPYTRWETKVWPWRHVWQLIDQTRDLPWVVVGQGPWFPLLDRPVLDLRGKLRLPELMGVLAQARAVVSTDSGPAHLAAALGVKTVALFGPTDPSRTAPVGVDVKILTGQLPCQPCLKRICPRENSVECLAQLLPETVHFSLTASVAD